MPIKGIGAIALASASLLAGCAKRQRMAPSIHLQELAGSTYLVPGRPAVIEGDKQTAEVRLGRVANANAAACTVREDVFSLGPPANSAPDLWMITSPSIRGWQTLPSDLDI